MRLDSYQKASADILKYIKEDPTIFIINSAHFKVLISASSTRKTQTFNNYEYVSILDVLPKIYDEIEDCLPYPSQQELNTSHFVTELIASYGDVWIPTRSLDYQLTEESFCDSINMVAWQRLLRARKSDNQRELTVLSIDPNVNVRIAAKKRLKTIKE